MDKNDNIEKSHDIYFHGFLDFLKKYKFNSIKRQHDHHAHRYNNHKSSNFKVKPSSTTFSDENFKANNDKKQNPNDMHDMNKVNRNVKGVEELKNRSQKHTHNNYLNHNNGCFKSFILLGVSKKKNLPSRVSSFEPPKTQNDVVERDLPKAKSLDPISSLGRSRSMNERKNEESGTQSFRTASMNRNASTRRSSMNRSTTSIGRSSASDVAGGVQKKSHISKSGPLIMFSNSSGLLKPPPIEEKLECSLEDLFYGCVKHIKVSRNLYTLTGLKRHEEEELRVKVKAGWKSGTKISFKGTTYEETPGECKGDIILIITEKHHPLFKRIDDDLQLEIEIPLLDSLTGCNINIPLLDKEQLCLEIKDIIYPGYEKIILGKGMPNLNNPNKRGDLKVKFLVGYPKNLSDEQRCEISRILSECHD
ncbi:unnamed protein product [Amaranthus hypochondriacus]